MFHNFSCVTKPRALRCSTHLARHTCMQDEDLALAKMLQEQERAFMMLAGAGGCVLFFISVIDTFIFITISLH